MFRPASSSSRSVNHSSHPTASRGDAHRRPDPNPCKQVFTWGPSYGSGRVHSYGSSPRRVPSSVGYGGHPSGQDAGSVFSSSSLYGRTPHLGGGSNSLDIDTNHWGSSLSSYGRTPHLGGGSNSLDINTNHWGSSSSDATSSNQVSFLSRVPDASSAFSTHSLDPAAPVASLPLPAAIPTGPILRPFKPTAPSSFSVPSRSARSVGGRSQLDPEPQAHTPIRASSSRSGRFMPSSEYGRLTQARSGLSPSSIPSSVGDGVHHGGFGGGSPSSVLISVGSLLPHHSNSSTRSEFSTGGDLISLLRLRL